MIHTEELTKQFSTTLAVDRLTLDVREGEVFGFLGPNGAGKTTTMRILSGLAKANSGRAWILEKEIGRPIKACSTRNSRARVRGDQRRWHVGASAGE